MRFTKVVIFAVFGGLLLLAGCSTTNHGPLPTMVYHDIVGHYNAYFNAHERLKAVYLTLDKTHKDNYKDVLSLYTYSNPKEATTVTGDLDDLEKRVTYSVQVHKVSNWADDDFLIMGKSNYIKGNYEKATAFLKYTTTEYKNGVDYVKERKKEGKVARPTLKKKPVKKPKFEQVLDDKGNLVLNKIDERPHYTWLIHEPARAEALVWLAKTYGALGKYAEATAVVQFMRSDDKFYTNLDKYVEATDAELLLRQKNYHDAIKPLEKFLTMTKKKSERVRPLFILAQLYELQGNYAKSSEYYKEVLKNRPNYDMEFYAKIRRAKLGNKSGGSQEEIKKLLAQMSHDNKYKDFFDQIYYELGEIALSENNRAEARKDYHKSVVTSTKNADQKALSYLKLAQMDYEDEAYVPSKFYYDTTMQNMAKNDTAYNGVESRDKTLDKLVKQINIISTEDSLQRVANMAAADRLKFIHKLLDKKQQEEDEKKAAKDVSKSANTDFIKPAGGTTIGAGGADDVASSFYFYNTTAKGNGYAEFIKRWGRRKLEDNWRRKDKAANDVADVVDSAALKKAAADTVSTPTPSSEEEKMLAGLPLTPEKLDKSNAKLVDAFYALGTVYKDDLQSYRKSINALEELNKRFPKNKLELESFYQLYLLYTKTKNTSKAEYYKEQILALYPASTIAKYLSDPTFLAEEQKKQNSVSYYYASAYDDYSKGEYASAEKKVLEVDAQFKENKIHAKFDLLNALILSKENRLGDYVQALQKIIAKYPKTPEKDQAQEWLDKLNHSKLPQVDISKLPKDSMDAAAALANAPLFTDTTGNSEFLKKVAGSRPKVAGDGPTAKADNAPKPTKDTASAKPYVPLTKAEKQDSVMKAQKAAQEAAIAKTIADRKAKQDSITAKNIAAKKAAQDAIDARIAARKVTQDSIAASLAAKKAAKDSLIAKNIAAKKAIQDSIAAAKAAKATGRAGTGAKAGAGGNAVQDSIAAKVAARKAQQDSLAAKNLAAKKVAQDAIDARIAAKKAAQDSINAKNLAAKKAAQDAIDARIAAKKAIQDSIAGRALTKPTAKDTIPKMAVPATATRISAKDSMAAAKLVKTKDSLAALKTAKDPAQAKLQARRDSMLAARAKQSTPITGKTASDPAQAKLQARRDSMLAARAKDSLANAKGAKASSQATLQARRDSMLAAKAAAAKMTADSLKKATKAAPKELPKAKPVAKDTAVKKPDAKAKPLPKDTVKTAPRVVATRPAFDTDTTTAIYGTSDNAPHNVIIYFLDPSVFSSASLTKLDAFDAAAYDAAKLTTRTIAIDNDNKLINIRSFKNKDEAMAYITALKAKMKEVLPALNDDQYFIGAISSLNYSTLISTRKINNYQHFYRTNYK